MNSIVARHGAFSVAVAAMVATPLFPVSGDERVTLATLVIVAWCAHALVGSARGWGWSRALVAFGVVVLVTTGVEVLGSSTGIPFGSYDYTGRLAPTILGVPAIVPLAWFAVGTFAREVAAATAATRVARVLLGALALTAWDLFLDPQMVTEGYWRWAELGPYRGIPLENYLGWLLTGVVVMAILDWALPPRATVDRSFVAAYTVIAVLQTVGFAVFFGDLLVAAVGGLGMLPLAILAVFRTSRGGARVAT